MIVTSFINLVNWLLSFLPDFSLPDLSIIDWVVSKVRESFSFFNVFLPIDHILSLIVAMIGFWIAVQTTKLILTAYKMIRG
jgi:hypothetical protein